MIGKERKNTAFWAVWKSVMSRSSAGCILSRKNCKWPPNVVICHVCIKEGWVGSVIQSCIISKKEMCSKWGKWKKDNGKRWQCSQIYKFPPNHTIIMLVWWEGCGACNLHSLCPGRKAAWADLQLPPPTWIPNSRNSCLIPPLVIFFPWWYLTVTAHNSVALLRFGFAMHYGQLMLHG